MMAGEESRGRSRRLPEMFLRIATAGLLVALGAFGAWASTRSPESTPVEPPPVTASAPMDHAPVAGRSPPVAPGTSAATAAPWSPSVQVSPGGSEAVGAVGRTLAVLPDDTRLIVWSGRQRGRPTLLSRSRDGEAWSAPVAVPGTQFSLSPNLAVAADGTVHLVVGMRQGPREALYHLRSTNGGRSWSTPVPISAEVSEPLRGQTVTVDARGRVHVAWHQGDPKQDGGRTRTWYTRSGPRGAGFSPPQALFPELPGHAAFPRLLLTGATGDVVAVPVRGQQDPPDWDVLVAISRDGGETFTTVSAVDTPFRDWDPEAWIAPDGTIHLAWMTQRGGGRGVTIDYSRSADFGATWTRPVSLNRVQGRFPSFAPLADGSGAWLLWKDERDWGTPPCVGRDRCADIAGLFTADNGRTWTEPELMTDLGDVELKFPSFTTGTDGRLHIMWSDQRQAMEQIHYQVREAL